MAFVEITTDIASQIKGKALELGFDRIGFSASPSVRSFPTAKTIVSLGIGYFPGRLPPKPGPGFGRVARFAWGRDYHGVIKERLLRLAEFLERELGFGRPLKFGADAMPLLEKPAAQAAGLGFIGKNSLLILPRFGSWAFLADFILENPLAENEIPKTSGMGCGACQHCRESCPTGALETPHQLDHARCISFLTIENKGEIPEASRKKLRDWIFGCDECQEICPFNTDENPKKNLWPEFEPHQGPGPWISLEEILRTPDSAAFKQRWKDSSLMRAKRKGLIRNACVAAGNSGDLGLVPALRALLNDSEPLIPIHARWALDQLEGE